MLMTLHDNTMRCPICQSGMLELKYTAGPLDYFRNANYPINCCVSCGYCNTTIPDTENRNAAYEEGNYDKGEGLLRKLLRPFLNWLEKRKLKLVLQYSDARSICEIGAGKGYFVREVIRNNIDCIGIEPSNRSYACSREVVGDAVLNTSLAVYSRSNKKKFDAVVLWHVLEHIGDLEETLAQIKGLLSEEGKLFIAVPNKASLQSRIGKARWYHLDPPRHIHHFTPSALKAKLEGNNFGIVDVRYDSFFQNYLGDLLTLLNLVTPMSNALVNFIKRNRYYYDTNKPLALVSILWNLLLLPLVLFPAMVLTLVSQLMRRAGTIVVVAEPANAHGGCPDRNVYFIDPVGGRAGMNYYDMELAKGMVSAGCCVHLYTCDETREQGSDAIRLHKYFRDIYGKDRKLVRAGRYIRGLLKSLAEIRHNAASLVHTHIFHFNVREVWTIAMIRLHGFRCVATVHDVESVSGKKGGGILVSLTLRLVNGVIVHNEFSLNELQKHADRQRKKARYCVIPSGNYINTCHAMEQSAARRKLGIADAAQVILFFGQLKKTKGLDVLAAAIPGIVDEHRDACFMVAGREYDAKYDDYKAMIPADMLANNCRFFTRFIREDEIDDFYSSADIVVLPYRKIYQSAVLLMAMSYGKCVVASNIPGMTGVVEEGINGFLFNDGDSDDLARVISRLLKDPDLRNSAASKGFETMQQQHDWKDIAQKTLEFYETVR